MKLVSMDEYETWVGPNLQTCITCACEEYDMKPSDYANASEVPAALLDTLTVHCEDWGDKELTFRKALELWIKEGKGVGMFCSTDR